MNIPVCCKFANNFAGSSKLYSIMNGCSPCQWPRTVISLVSNCFVQSSCSSSKVYLGVIQQRCIKLFHHHRGLQVVNFPTCADYSGNVGHLKSSHQMYAFVAKLKVFVFRRPASR